MLNVIENASKSIPTVVNGLFGKKGQTQTENNGTKTMCPSCNKPFLLPSPVPNKIQCPNCQAILTREAETPHTQSHKHEGEEAVGEQKNLGSFEWHEEVDFKKRRALGIFHIKIVAKDEENAKQCRFYIPLIKTFLLTGTINENIEEGGET